LNGDDRKIGVIVIDTERKDMYPIIDTQKEKIRSLGLKQVTIVLIPVVPIPTPGAMIIYSN